MRSMARRNVPEWLQCALVSELWVESPAGHAYGPIRRGRGPLGQGLGTSGLVARWVLEDIFNGLDEQWQAMSQGVDVQARERLCCAVCAGNLQIYSSRPATLESTFRLYSARDRILDDTP